MVDENANYRVYTANRIGYRLKKKYKMEKYKEHSLSRANKEFVCGFCLSYY